MAYQDDPFNRKTTYTDYRESSNPYRLDVSKVVEDNETGATIPEKEASGKVAGAIIGGVSDIIVGSKQNEQLDAAQNQARELEAEENRFSQYAKGRNNAFREKEMNQLEQRMILNQKKQTFQAHYDRLVDEFQKQNIAFNGFSEAANRIKDGFKNENYRNSVLNMWSKS